MKVAWAGAQEKSHPMHPSQEVTQLQGQCWGVEDSSMSSSAGSGLLLAGMPSLILLSDPQLSPLLPV